MSPCQVIFRTAHNGMKKLEAMACVDVYKGDDHMTRQVKLKIMIWEYIPLRRAPEQCLPRHH